MLSHLSVAFLTIKSLGSSPYEPLNPQNESSNIHFGGPMRNYTYIDGTRFIVANLFRSLRYDIDRLDMSWVGDQKPIFSRGFRIVDNDESNTVTLDGEDADNLIYSLTYMFSNEETTQEFREAVDEFLKDALITKNYLINSKGDIEKDKSTEAESLLH
jgi:hypothetical protein